MPHEGLGGADFLATLQQHRPPGQHLAGSQIFLTGHLEPGHVIPLHVSNLDFLAFDGGAVEGEEGVGGFVVGGLGGEGGGGEVVEGEGPELGIFDDEEMTWGEFFNF